MPALLAWVTTLLLSATALAQTESVPRPSTPGGPMPWSLFAVIGLVALLGVLAWVFSRRGHGGRRSIRF